MQVKIVDQDRDFFALRQDWNRLLSCSACDNIFLTWEWMYSWWKHFKNAKKLVLLTVWENGCLVGLAPLYAEKTTYFGIRPLVHLEFIGSTHVCSEYLDFIIVSGRENSILPFLLNKIFYGMEEIGWDVLNFVAVKQDSLTRRICSSFFDQNKIVFNDYAIRDLPYIKFPDTLDDYLKTLSRDRRNRFKRYKRNLDEEYNVELLTVQNSTILEQCFNDFMMLHQKRWVDKRGEGIFASRNVEVIQFHKELVKILLDNGWLQLVFLKVNNEIVAGQYNYIYKNRILNYCVGFDPRWGASQVGTVLLLSLVEEAIRGNIDEFDFLRGNEPYKLSWTKNSRRTVDTVVWRNRRIQKRVSVERSIRKYVKSIIPQNLSNRLYSKFFGRG